MTDSNYFQEAEMYEWQQVWIIRACILIAFVSMLSVAISKSIMVDELTAKNMEMQNAIVTKYNNCYALMSDPMVAKIMAVGRKTKKVGA